LDGFWVDTGHSERSVSFRLFNIQNVGNPASLTVRIEAKTKIPNNWTPLIEGIMKQWPCIGAWQWGHLYRVWQWCSIPNEYERLFGTMPPGFRKYSINPIPPSTQPRNFVDISSNPGRPKELMVG